MAQHVWVENAGSKPYKDTFREREINIPSGGRIEMQRREAIIFLGCMSPTGPDGKPIEKNLKMIPVMSSDGQKVESGEFVCNFDGKRFLTQSELDAHLKTVAGRTVTREQVDKAKRKEE